MMKEICIMERECYDDDYGDMSHDPDNDCPRCHGAGECILSDIEWDYYGPDYGTCPQCGGTGRNG